MRTTIKLSESAVYQRRLGIFLAEAPPTDRTKHFLHALNPALRSDPMVLSGASPTNQIPSSQQHIRLSVNQPAARETAFTWASRLQFGNSSRFSKRLRTQSSFSKVTRSSLARIYQISSIPPFFRLWSGHPHFFAGDYQPTVSYSNSAAPVNLNSPGPGRSS